MLDEGMPMRHVDLGRNVPMYRTNIPTAHGRPLRRPAGGVDAADACRGDAIRAVQITSRFPAVHGAPVHLGDPAQIGIADLAQADYGDAVPVRGRRTAGVLGLRRDARRRPWSQARRPCASRTPPAPC
jgi:uncharacterized protein YcsI (UPF0317 family)